MRRRDLDRLKGLAGALFEAELAEVKRVAEAKRRVEGLADAHREARAARSRTLAGLDAPDPAARAAADPLWLLWSDRELGRIQAERARLEAEGERTAVRARRALGRSQALDRLAERLAAEARRRRERRAQEGS